MLMAPSYVGPPIVRGENHERISLEHRPGQRFERTADSGVHVLDERDTPCLQVRKLRLAFAPAAANPREVESDHAAR